MNWFTNRKIGTKIITGFLLVAVIAGVIGLVGINGISTIARLDDDMYHKMTSPLKNMVLITESFQRLRGNVKDIILAETSAEIDDYESRIKDRFKDFDENLDIYEDTLFTEEGAKLVKEVKDLRAQYESTTKDIIRLVRTGNKAAALVLVKGEGNTIRTMIEEKYRRLSEIKDTAADKTATDNQATAKATTTTMIIVLAGGMLIALLIGIFISGSISRPLKKALTMIEEMGRGHLSERLNLKSADEVGKMGQAMDRFADDLQNKMVGNMKRIAAGDVSMELALVDQQDEITPALKTMIDAIRRMVADAGMLAQAAQDGALGTRADASRHGGDFRKIVEGVNETLDAVIKPVQEASVVLGEMAKGNLKLRVSGNYRGDHAIIKNAMNETLDEVSGYIDEISSVLTSMANSNMDVAVTGNYRGDFAPIKQALNLIIETFNDMLAEMNNAAEQVAAGSRQVSDGSQELSQGATEQASSIEQLTASITEIAAQTRQNAVNANEANELAVKAKDNAVGGNTQMKEMLKAMGDINTSSTNISKIIKVIDEIAFQTNILALNAAVEAARAGQHGKGFAVVAEEVRNLAARSASAAKETTDLIEGSIQKVAAGTRIADETARALDQIVNDVTRAASLVGSIAAASNEQASGIAQVNQGVEQVSQVVQANSATSEESAAASEELSSQADLLKSLINRFNLKKAAYRLESRPDRTVDQIARDRGQVIAQGSGRQNPMTESAGVRKKPRISLNDTEFGKF